MHFDILGYKVPSIAEEEQTFLGRFIFFSGKSKECLNLLEKTIKKKLDHLESTVVRAEFKIEI